MRRDQRAFADTREGGAGVNVCKGRGLVVAQELAFCQRVLELFDVKLVGFRGPPPIDAVDSSGAQIRIPRAVEGTAGAGVMIAASEPVFELSLRA